MAAKCKKCDPHEICEECPEWIFTLADLIMCMMGLFVILWCLKESGKPAMSPAQQAQVEQKENAYLEDFKKGFVGFMPDPTAPKQELSPNMNGRGEKGDGKTVPENPEGPDHTSQNLRTSETSTEDSRLQFEKGSDELMPAVRKRLDSIIDTIKGHRQIIMIKGHTSLDDFQNGGSEDDKFGLSFRRAKRVQDYLIAHGVAADTLRLVPCSTYEPVRQHVSLAEQASNRRVEVEPTKNLVKELQDPQQEAKPVEGAAKN